MKKLKTVLLSIAFLLALLAGTAGIANAETSITWEVTPDDPALNLTWE